MNERTLRLALGAALAASTGCQRTATAPAAPRRDLPAAPSAPAPTGAPPPAAATIDPPAPAEQFRDAARWLPQGEVAGWRQSGNVVRSTGANLFQEIDGSAPSYEQYGIRNYAKSYYRRPGTQLVATVELYEFADALGAFGRYSYTLANGRDPASLAAQAVDGGSGGFQSSQSRTFWRGVVLAEVNISEEGDEPDEGRIASAAATALPAFAASLVSRIPDAPAPRDPLPTADRVWGGATYLADGALGLENSGPAWVGHYREASGRRHRALVIAGTDAADARRRFSRLRPATATPIAAVGEEAFAMSPGGGGEVLVARQGPVVVGIADGAGEGTAPLDRATKLALLRSLLATPIALDAPARAPAP